MRLLSEILFAPFTGPVHLAEFATNSVRQQVEAEYFNEGKVQADLLDLTMRYDRGEVDDEEFKRQEADILEHLNQIRAYREAQRQ